VRRVVGTPRPLAGWQETPAVALWSQTYREVLATVEGLPVPATLLAPAAGLARPESPWLVWVDPGGRRAALESAGPAAQLSRMLERDTGDLHPHVLVPDLPGWGESTPALVPYALAGWGSMDRLTAYLSCAVGDAVLALRTRCTAALVDHLHAAFGMPYARLVLAGRGLGGAVALMAAALTPVPLGGLVAWSAPASFQDLAEAESYTWPAAAFLPDVLASFDLPEIARALPVPVAILDPRDAAGTSLAEPAARALFGELPAAGSLLLGPCSASQALAATRSLLARAGT